MPATNRFVAGALSVVAVLAGVVACASPASNTPSSTDPGTGPPVAPSSSDTPAWYDIELTDVRNGDRFTINDLRGKVVLIETMAQWCPTCVTQQAEIVKLHDQLGDRDDVVSVSLDVDLNEDAATLREYVADHGYDWRFAVAPLEVARALGNLYSAQYLNPPLAPMLVIHRDGTATQLPFGVKDVDALRTLLDPFLAP
jgi:cytochrome oxidase Cu insertion factor (SCO1/SenC/PrrC family)